MQMGTLFKMQLLEVMITTYIYLQNRSCPHHLVGQVRSIDVMGNATSHRELLRLSWINAEDRHVGPEVAPRLALQCQAPMISWLADKV